jgi:hypothetical protein
MLTGSTGRALQAEFIVNIKEEDNVNAAGWFGRRGGRLRVYGQLRFLLLQTGHGVFAAHDIRTTEGFLQELSLRRCARETVQNPTGTFRQAPAKE